MPNTNLAKKKLNLSTKINFENAIELSLGKMKISIVTPTYNEVENIEKLYF